MNQYPWLELLYDNLRQYNQIHPLSLIVTAENGLGVDAMIKSWIQSLICEHNVCHKCQQCQLMKSNSHPDYWEAVNDKSVAIDDIRSILNFIYLKPRSASKRIVYIPFAEKLTLQASNALLKILEEPPAHAVFILGVENDALLLPTILSRCIVFNANSIDVSMATQWLKGQLNCSLQESELRMILSANRPLIAKGMNLTQVNEFLSNCMNPTKPLSELEPVPDDILQWVHLMQIQICRVLQDEEGMNKKASIFLIEWYYILSKFSKRLHRSVVWNKEIIWEEILLALRWHYCKFFKASQ
ncbi:MAG TPA: hypothetical protein QF353_04515 [Gammaproteobacteria bacterium]|nr:hypothetical protein [Gammaproteobacteria bacterium]